MTDFGPILTSPRDWPAEWQELRTIDNLLRCSICSEFFNNATVVPSCSHNYCSLCIRKYLIIQSKCPSCYVSINENQLENNRIIDEIVRSFVLLRSRLLEMIKSKSVPNSSEKTKKSFQSKTYSFIKSTKPVNNTKKKVASHTPTRSSKASQKRQRSVLSGGSTSGHSSGDTSSVVRKRQKRHSIIHDDDDDDDDMVKSDYHMVKSDDHMVKSEDNGDAGGGKLGDHAGGEHVSGGDNGDGADDDHVGDDGNEDSTGDTNGDGGDDDKDYRPSGDDGEDGDDEEDIGIKKVVKSSPRRSLASTFKKIQKDTDNTDLVDCPVCRQKIHPAKINSHLDTCLTSTERKENLRSTSSQSTSEDLNYTMSPVGANSLIPKVTKRKHINKLVYTQALLSDRKLKEKLKEYGLSVKGDRQTLIKRHQEFTIAYNSECSKPQPKSVSEIVRFVEEEESRKKKLQNNRANFNFDHKQSLDEIDKIKNEYMVKNEAQFSRLINEIKNREEKKEITDTKSSKGSKTKTPPAKRKSNLFDKFDDDTTSNSSIDFEPTTKRYNTPRRKKSHSPSIVTERQTRSSTKKSMKACSHDVVDDDVDNSAVNVVNTSFRSGSSTKISPTKISPTKISPTKISPTKISPTKISPTVPDPPSLSLLDNVDEDATSSGSESLLAPAFGPSSPVTKQIPGTPDQYDSEEFVF